jgi:tRNA-dihydrouridine synthase C
VRTVNDPELLALQLKQWLSSSHTDVHERHPAFAELHA